MNNPAGFFLLAVLASPVVAACVGAFAVFYSRRARLSKPPVTRLVIHSLVYSLLACGLTIGYTFWSMTRYEANTGFSAGNGPLALTFLLPAAVAAGLVLALVQWWFWMARQPRT